MVKKTTKMQAGSVNEVLGADPFTALKIGECRNIKHKMQVGGETVMAMNVNICRVSMNKVTMRGGMGMSGGDDDEEEFVVESEITREQE